MSNAIVSAVSNSGIRGVAQSLGAATKGLPHLPKPIIEFIASIIPFASVLVGGLSLFSALVLTPSLLVFNQQMISYGGQSMNVFAGTGPLLFVSIVFLVVIGVLLVAAFPSLMKREYEGWLTVLAADLVSVVYGVLSFVLAPIGGSPITTVLSTIIGFYVWFELKALYTPVAKKK